MTPTPDVKAALALPENTPEFMAPAYYGCLYWAIGFEPVRKQFEAQTGVKMPRPPKNAIEAMVDKDTGYQVDYLLKFKAWHDVNVWGDLDAPDESPVLASLVGEE